MSASPRQRSYRGMLRIAQLEHLIRSGKSLTVKLLAKSVEASRRSVQRDLRYMQETMNMPIEYDRKARQWRMTKESVQLPGVHIGTEELLALQVVRRAIEAQREPGLAGLAQKALDCFTLNMTEAVAEQYRAMDSVISYRGSSRKLSDEADPNVFPVLVTCALRCEEVEVMYTNAEDGDLRPRIFRPYHLFLLDEKWYVFGRYPGETIVRKLLLTRMSQIRSTGRKFKRPARFNPAKLLANSVGIYAGGEPVTLRLRLYGKVAIYLAERPLHPSQQIVPLPEQGTYELTVHVAMTPEVEGIVLRWGSRIDVLEPLSLREVQRQNAREILARG